MKLPGRTRVKHAPRGFAKEDFSSEPAYGAAYEYGKDTYEYARFARGVTAVCDAWRQGMPK